MKMTIPASVSAFLVLSLSLAIPSGYSIGAILLLLLSLYALLFARLQTTLDKHDRLLVWTFIIYALCLLMYVFYDGLVPRNFERPSRYLLIVPVLLFLLKVHIRKAYLFYGAAIGAFAALGVSLYEKVVLGAGRAAGSTHVVMYGDVSMLLGLLCLPALMLFFYKRNYILMVVAFWGAFSGVFSAILSGTRGSWIVLPFVLLFVMWSGRKLFGSRNLYIVLFVFIMIVVSAYSVPQTGISARVAAAVSNIEYYMQGQKVSSLGHRFEMWKASWYMFKEAPILGVGKSSFRKKKRDYASRGLIHSSVVEIYGHSHNEYLHALAVRGIVGLVLLMLLYLVPLWLFWRKIKTYSDNWPIRSYATAGAIIPIAYMGFGLSDCLFMANITIILYLFCISFFWAATRWAEREYLGHISPDIKST